MDRQAEKQINSEADQQVPLQTDRETVVLSHELLRLQRQNGSTGSISMYTIHSRRNSHRNARSLNGLEHRRFCQAKLNDV